MVHVRERDTIMMKIMNRSWLTDRCDAMPCDVLTVPFMIMMRAWYMDGRALCIILRCRLWGWLVKRVVYIDSFSEECEPVPSSILIRNVDVRSDLCDELRVIWKGWFRASLVQQNHRESSAYLMSHFR